MTETKSFRFFIVNFLMKGFFKTDFIQIMSGVDLTQKQRRKTAFFIFVRAFIQLISIFLPNYLEVKIPNYSLNNSALYFVIFTHFLLSRRTFVTLKAYLNGRNCQYAIIKIININEKSEFNNHIFYARNPVKSSYIM